MAFDLSSFSGKTITELFDHLYPERTPKKNFQSKNEEQEQFITVETKLRDPGAEKPTFLDDSGAKYPVFNKYSTCHYAAGRFYRTSDGRPGEFSGYTPSLKRISDATDRQLSPILFRVTHDESGGQNQEGSYLSQAAKFGLGKADFFALSNTEIKESLHNHEVAKRCDSHWISFTDSAIAAKAYGLQLFEQKKGNVRIHMVDTTKIRNLPLIVHAYPMLKGYRVCSNRKSSFQRMIIGASYTQYLVWDELQVEACSVDVSLLIQVEVLELPIKLKVPIKRLGRQGHKRKFQTASRIRQSHLKLEESRVVEHMRDNYTSGPYNLWKKRERTCAFWGNRKSTTPIAIREKIDTRSHMSTDMMNRYRIVAQVCEKPRFQLVMLVALLSMSRPAFYSESMVEQLMQIPQDDPMFEDLHCFTTGLAMPAKPEVRAFQSIFANFVKRRKGPDAVKHISEAGRVIVRLDLDPKTISDEGKHQCAPNLVRKPDEAGTNLTVEYLEDRGTVDDCSAGEADRVQKRRKISEGSFHSVSRSLLPSQSSIPVSQGATHEEPMPGGLPDEVHEKTTPESSSAANSSKETNETEWKDDASVKETAVNTTWALACRTAAVGVENYDNPLMELEVDDFEEVEDSEEFKGIYHLVDC